MQCKAIQTVPQSLPTHTHKQEINMQMSCFGDLRVSKTRENFILFRDQRCIYLHLAARQI